MSSAEPPAKPGLLQRLDLLYFVLAGIDLLTICAALFLNHLTTTAFEEGVRTSAAWSVRQADIIHLSRLAQEVDAPGNDIFISRNMQAERRRFEPALAKFRRERARISQEVGSALLSSHDADILARLTEIQQVVDRMAAETETIFNEFAHGHEERASRGMAVMDRSYAVLTAKMDETLSVVETGRAAHLEEQLARARAARGLEVTVAVAVLFIVGLVATYGAYMGRTIRAAERQRRHMIEQLEIAHERLQHYADDVSHELRGPISKMRLDAEVLLQLERTPAQYRDGVESILLECQRLSSIVESLLFLARADNAAMTVQLAQLDASRELDVIAEFFRPAAEEAGMRLVVSAENVALWADRSLFQRALSNLVSNALKHGAGGTRVEIAAKAFPGGVLIEVTDDGPGIPEDMLARAFNRFQRAGASTEGLGLGLAIVKGVMDVHGGSIELASNGGRGLVARMKFPEKLR